MADHILNRIAEPNLVSIRPFKPGIERNAGAAWSFRDSVSNGKNVRTFYHHGTAMMEFSRPVGCAEVGAGGWEFSPLSSGWLSVSDQSGCNAVGRAYGWYFNRAGAKRGADGCGWVPSSAVGRAG